MSDLVSLLSMVLLVGFAVFIVWIDGKRHAPADYSDDDEAEQVRRMIEAAERDQRRRDLEAAVDEMVRDARGERR